MEILIAIAPLFIFVVFSVIILIQEWITDMRFYRRRHLKEIRRSLGKVEYVKTTLPTGEIDILGPGKVFIFDKQKVGTVTGTSLLCNEELEEMGATLDEAERLIKEAHNRTVG
jgi:hypothetical protein